MLNVFYIFLAVAAVMAVIGIIVVKFSQSSDGHSEKPTAESLRNSENRVSEFRLAAANSLAGKQNSSARQSTDLTAARRGGISAASAQQSAERKNATTKSAIAKPASNQTSSMSKNGAVGTIKKTNLAPRVGLSSNLKSPDHKHPLEQGAEYRVERVDMGGSLGGEITEGCIDQYFQRLVKITKEEEETAEPRYDLIKTVVFGEMLANPKFKNPRNR